MIWLMSASCLHPTLYERGLVGRNRKRASNELLEKKTARAITSRYVKHVGTSRYLFKDLSSPHDWNLRSN